MCILFRVSLLPIYSTQAGGEFGSVCFVVIDALTTLSVTRTSLFCTGAIYVIMWTGHMLFKFLCLLLKCFDSLQVCLFYRRKGIVEPVGISDKSLCVEWLFGISELPHFRQVLQYVSFVRIIFVHIIYILRFSIILFTPSVSTRWRRMVWWFGCRV